MRGQHQSLKKCWVKWHHVGLVKGSRHRHREEIWHQDSLTDQEQPEMLAPWKILHLVATGVGCCPFSGSAWGDVEKSGSTQGWSEGSWGAGTREKCHPLLSPLSLKTVKKEYKFGPHPAHLLNKLFSPLNCYRDSQKSWRSTFLQLCPETSPPGGLCDYCPIVSNWYANILKHSNQRTSPRGINKL